MKGVPNMNTKSLLYGFVTGIALGSIATLLTTPKSGNEVQKIIKDNYDKLNDFMSNAKKETIAVKDQVKETIQISTDTIKTVSNELKDSVQTWQSEVEPALAKLKEDIEQLTKSVQSYK